MNIEEIRAVVAQARERADRRACSEAEKALLALWDNLQAVAVEHAEAIEDALDSMKDNRYPPTYSDKSISAFAAILKPEQGAEDA